MCGNVNVAHCNTKLTVASVLESEVSLKLCPICSNEAGRHNHYGGRGCSSCRAFFRRSVQNNAYKKFVCKSQQSRLQFCIIDSKSWKSCKFCRYQKVPFIYYVTTFREGGGTKYSRVLILSSQLSIRTLEYLGGTFKKSMI